MGDGNIYFNLFKIVLHCSCIAFDCTEAIYNGFFRKKHFFVYFLPQRGFNTVFRYFLRITMHVTELLSVSFLLSNLYQSIARLGILINLTWLFSFSPISCWSICMWCAHVLRVFSCWNIWYIFIDFKGSVENLIISKRKFLSHFSLKTISECKTSLLPCFGEGKLGFELVAQCIWAWLSDGYCWWSLQ